MEQTVEARKKDIILAVKVGDKSKFVAVDWDEIRLVEQIISISISGGI